MKASSKLTVLKKVREYFDIDKTKSKKRLAYNGYDLFFDNFSFYINEFILYKLEIEITCLRLKHTGLSQS